MGKPRDFEKPMGVRDWPPEAVAQKRWIEKRVEARFQHWGYREVMTPTLEYFETVGGASAIQDHKLFKLLDRQGQTLVLRPDQTTPIARVVASVMKEVPLPLRLFYHANVFRAQEREAGRNAEFYQSGVELVGGDTPEEDAEVIALAVESLQACEISPIQLAMGHIGLLDGLLMERLEEAEAVADLKDCLGRRNMVEFRERVEALELNAGEKKELFSLLEIRGTREILGTLRDRAASRRTREAINHLEAIWEALEDWGVASEILLDLSLVGSLDYYTGVYFEGYGADGIYLLSGGRYDRLLERFGRSSPARGFALKTDRLVEAGGDKTREKMEHIALVYPRRLRRKAFRQAKKWREQGVAVSMHVKEAGSLPAEERQRLDRIVEIEGDDDD
ncbi:ATP phosphoribosyltransferase regulatory subunit [Paludifilum halophilum]|uniref:ATP phosphoribosyltransferase regulatory subunit n=1 Tax=Paludifilum halophilum TaxID=1642702 RepID=A0A235B755_9BACL|nr:ATP phosphoribosyltransferase regulatory subunit [Paludifilum halophilum]OYD08143.1 ATP phosphoribosyltransferase regulatory subunit [Paludifilum halophilum]